VRKKKGVPFLLRYDNSLWNIRSRSEAVYNGASGLPPRLHYCGPWLFTSVIKSVYGMAVLYHLCVCVCVVKELFYNNTKIKMRCFLFYFLVGKKSPQYYILYYIYIYNIIRIVLVFDYSTTEKKKLKMKKKKDPFIVNTTQCTINTKNYTMKMNRGDRVGATTKQDTLYTYIYIYYC